MFGMQFNIGPSRQTLKRAADLLGDMTPVFQTIGDYLIEETRERFRTGTAPDGSKWAPKSQTTLERYKKLGYGGSAMSKVLYARGALSETVQRSTTKDSVTIGSNQIYSRVMQEGAAKGAFGRTSKGGPIPWGRIPARIWLGLNAENEQAIIDIAEEAIEERLGQGG